MVRLLSSARKESRTTLTNLVRMLLKYISRDTIELLASGSLGVSEARAALAQYEEKSPLYGLISFRRKKVLIKYIPEGTSRLLQGMRRIAYGQKWSANSIG